MFGRAKHQHAKRVLSGVWRRVFWHVLTLNLPSWYMYLPRFHTHTGRQKQRLALTPSVPAPDLSFLISLQDVKTFCAPSELTSRLTCKSSPCAWQVDSSSTNTTRPLNQRWYVQRQRRCARSPPECVVSPMKCYQASKRAYAVFKQVLYLFNVTHIETSKTNHTPSFSLSSSFLHFCTHGSTRAENWWMPHASTRRSKSCSL